MRRGGIPALVVAERPAPPATGTCAFRPGADIEGAETDGADSCGACTEGAVIPAPETDGPVTCGAETAGIETCGFWKTGACTDRPGSPPAAAGDGAGGEAGGP